MVANNLKTKIGARISFNLSSDWVPAFPGSQKHPVSESLSLFFQRFLVFRELISRQKHAELHSRMSIMAPITSEQDTASRKETANLMSLPVELRLRIFELLFHTAFRTKQQQVHDLPHPLMAVCKDIRNECLPILMRGLNMEVRASLPDRPGSNSRKPSRILTSHGIRFVKFRPIVTFRGHHWDYMDAKAHLWFEFCKTGLPSLIPLCGSITLQTWFKESLIELVITIQNQKPLTWNVRSPGTRHFEKIGDTLVPQLIKKKAHWEENLIKTNLSSEIINILAKDFMFLISRVIHKTKDFDVTNSPFKRFSRDLD